MIRLLRTIGSSFGQARDQLVGNKLRTALSLLGVSIGIFCIVAVQAAVDSLQGSVMDSLSKLGDETLYIQQMPWSDDSPEDYMKHQRRPRPTFAEYEAVSEQLKGMGEASFYTIVGGRTLKWRNNSLQGVVSVAGSEEMASFFGLEFQSGRYFNPSEFRRGGNVIVLGHTISEELFGSVDPVGREVRMFGQQLEVVGVITKGGEDLLQVMNFDEAVLLPYGFAAKAVNLEADLWFSSLMARPVNAPKQQVEDEVRMAMRAERRLRPLEEDDFAINNLSMLADILDSVFSALNKTGYFIGLFAILVGGFSVANIMFVSVQERTSIIGVKMAMGAPRPVILTEFLFEAIALCLIGGAVGLALVLLTMLGLNQVMPYEMTLSLRNVLVGLGLSLVIGVLSGILPAARASRLDPVEAIRA